MKRILLCAVAAAVFSLVNAGPIRIKKETFKVTSSLSNDTVVDANGQLVNRNLTAMHIAWPTTSTGQVRDVAAIEIKFSGLPAEELDKIHFSAKPGEPVRVERNTAYGVTATVFVPGNTDAVSLYHPRFGSDTIVMPIFLRPRTLYSVEAELEALHKVEVKAAADPGLVPMITLGDFGQKPSPAIFDNVPNGVYRITVGAGTDQNSTEVAVDIRNTDFDYQTFKDLDLRHKRNVTFKTKGDKNTNYYLDGEYVGTGEEVTAVVPFGPHSVKAEINKDKYDERAIEVDANTDRIFFAPQARKTLEFVGLYNGHAVPTSIISATGVNAPAGYSTSHQLRLPADNQSFTITLSDEGGHKGKKSLKITEKMPVDHQIKLQSGRAFVWPWESEYRTAKWGWEFSYVTKQIVVSGESDDDSVNIETGWNGVWSDGFNHWLHGIRTGFHFQPAFKFGLGLYTGLFGEFYLSSTKDESSDFKDYFEFDLSIPLHILYQFPLGKKIAVGFHTGLGFNWSLAGTYYEDFGSTYETDKENVEFGEPPYPKAFSINWDFALWLRLGPIYLSGTVSKGMSDLGCFPDFGLNAKSVMKKYIVGASVVF